MAAPSRPSAFAVLRLMTSSNLGRLHDRQVGRLLALEDAAGIDAGLTIRIRDAGPVAHQAAGRSKFAQRVDRWQRVAGCQRDNVFAPAGEECIGNDEKCVGALLGKRGENCVDLASVLALRIRSCCPMLRAAFCTSSNCSAASARVGFRSSSYQWSFCGTKFVQQFQSLCSESLSAKCHARNVAARPGEAGDEADFDRDQRR